MGLAEPAFADDPQPAPPPAPPAPAPAPQPQPGRIRLDVQGGMAVKSRTYVLNGGNVTVAGHVQPYVSGQTIRIRISSAHRKPTVIHTKIAKGKGEGTFKVRFRARRAVTYAVFARHDATAEQALFQAKVAAQAVNADGAGPGSRGVGIALLKQGLRALGYPAGNGPFWTGKLGREIMAFRKTNNMARVFTANREVFRMVFAGRGAFNLIHPKAGKHVEFDWSRQVVALADGGKVVATYHASSGKPSTPTVFGTFHFYLKAPGTNAKGMFDSNFFIRGYAIHGYPEVPTYAASHGCIRVPNADAPAIFAWVRLGDPIFVYP
ncbi:MAG: L,D-transpeptidase [Thermoleophilaceae bacterium]